MTTVTVGIPPFIPFLLIFILWIYIFVLYIRRKDGTKCTYNPYATGHIGQRGLGTLRANSPPEGLSSVPAGRARPGVGWGGGSLGPAALRLRPVDGRPSTAAWTPAAENRFWSKSPGAVKWRSRDEQVPDARRIEGGEGPVRRRSRGLGRLVVSRRDLGS